MALGGVDNWPHFLVGDTNWTSIYRIREKRRFSCCKDAQYMFQDAVKMSAVKAHELSVQFVVGLDSLSLIRDLLNDGNIVGQIQKAAAKAVFYFLTLEADDSVSSKNDSFLQLYAKSVLYSVTKKSSCAMREKYLAGLKKNVDTLQLFGSATEFFWRCRHPAQRRVGLSFNMRQKKRIVSKWTFKSLFWSSVTYNVEIRNCLDYRKPRSGNTVVSSPYH